MSIQPGVGYSVSNLGNVSSLSIDTIIPEAQPKQFECSIVRKGGENPEYHLRVRRGLIEFDYFKCDENGFIDPDGYGVDVSAYEGGPSNPSSKTHVFTFSKYFNVFPDDSLVTGNNNNSEFLNNDGYIKLEEGEDYFVFIAKLTPDLYGMPTQPGPPIGIPEAKTPQICVMRCGGEQEQIQPVENGCGSFVECYQKNPRYAQQWTGMIDFYNQDGIPTGSHAFGPPINDNIGYVALWGWIDPNQGIPLYYGNKNEDAPGLVSINELSYDDNGKIIRFKTMDCIRKDIAYIKWNAGLKRFQIFQINYGPINLRQLPIGPVSVVNFSPMSAEAKAATDFLKDEIYGYTKTPNSLYDDCVLASMIRIGKYQEPYENS